MMDLYVGYDECALAKSSWDLTMFQTPYGALRLCYLCAGQTLYPSSMMTLLTSFNQRFLHVTQPYIDDVPV